MSVINRVLKDLDRQGANTAAPSGVVAVIRSEPSLAWRRRIGMLVVAVLLISALAWYWTTRPARETPLRLQPHPDAPQLRLSQQLTTLQQATPDPAPIPAAPTDTVTEKPQSAGAAPAPIAFLPDAPRLDTRLPQPGPRSSVPTETGPSVVKEIKPLTPRMQAEEAWRQASRLLEQGRPRQARESLEAALRLDPEHDAARQNLIALALDDHQASEAETLLREGVTLHPEDPWYPRGLAQLQLQRGELTQAVAGLKQALARRPDAANWALYAGALHKLGKPAEAASAFREAVRLDASQGKWWLGMAVALEQAGDPAAAEAAYRRALQTRLSSELREYAQQRIGAPGQR